MARVIGSFERVKLLSPQRKEYGDKVVSTRGDLTFEKVAEKFGVDSLPNAIKTLDSIATSKGVGMIAGAATREDQKEADTRYKKEQDKLLKKETAEARSAVEKQKKLIEKLKTKPKDERVSVVRKLQKDFDAATNPETKAQIRRDQRFILQSLIDQDEIDPAVLNKFPQFGAGTPQKVSPPPSPAEQRKVAPTPPQAAGEGTFGPFDLSLREAQKPMGQPRLDPDAIDRARRTLGIKLTDLARQGNKEGLDTAISRVPPALRLPILQDAMDKLVKGTGTEKAKKIVADAADKVIQVQLTEQQRPTPTPPKDYTIRPKSDKPEDIESAVFDVAVDYKVLTDAELTPENLRRNRQVKQSIIDFIRTLPEDKQFGFIEEMRLKYEELDGGKSPIFRNIKTQFARERELALPQQVIRPGGPAEEATPQPPPPPVATEAPTPVAPSPATEMDALAAASAKDPLGFYERMKALDRQAEMMDAEEQLKIKEATLKAQEDAFRASAPQLQQYLTGKIGIRELNSRGKVPLTSSQLMALARSATTPAAQAKVLGLMSNVVDRPSTTLYGMATGQDEFNYAMKVAKLFPRIAPIKPERPKTKEELDAQRALAEQRRASARLSGERELDIREMRPAKKEKLRAEAERARTTTEKIDEQIRDIRQGRKPITWKPKFGPEAGKVKSWDKFQVELYRKLVMAEKVSKGRGSGASYRQRRRQVADDLEKRYKQVGTLGADGIAALKAKEAEQRKKRDAAEATLRQTGGVPPKPTGDKETTADGLMRTAEQQKEWQKADDKYRKAVEADKDKKAANDELAKIRQQQSDLRREVRKAQADIRDAKERFIRRKGKGRTPKTATEFIKKKTEKKEGK
jgi:hypothetical protein